jgi:hypothetical protein
MVIWYVPAFAEEEAVIVIASFTPVLESVTGFFAKLIVIPAGNVPDERVMDWGVPLMVAVVLTDPLGVTLTAVEPSVSVTFVACTNLAVTVPAPLTSREVEGAVGLATLSPAAELQEENE